MMTRILAKGYLWLLLALLYSPILIIMIFSFTEAKVLGNWTGFSTKLYSSLFTGGMHHSLMNAIWNTFAIAMLAATASTALGSIAAIGIFNLRTRTRQVMNFANAIPMMNADIITGVSLFLLFVSFGISQGFTTVVLAHITFCTPYVVLSVMPRLKKMNQNVYEAALDLGATPFQALRKVILPEIFPGMISGFILAFTSLHRRLRSNHIHHRERRTGNALHLHLRRCPQRRTDTGAAPPLHHNIHYGAGAADRHQQTRGTCTEELKRESRHRKGYVHPAGRMFSPHETATARP